MERQKSKKVNKKYEHDNLLHNSSFEIVEWRNDKSTLSLLENEQNFIRTFGVAQAAYCRLRSANRILGNQL